MSNENGISNIRSSSGTNPLSSDDSYTEEEQATHELDTEEMQLLLRKIKGWHEQEMRKQSANRFQMAMDEDYYDGLQWTQEDANVLLDRGQAPLVFNEIKPTMDWIIGTERRTRIDHKVLARRKDEASRKDAEIKTMLLKYLSDVNKTPFSRSFAFESAAKAGIGWIETGVRNDPTEELLYTRNENWRNMLHDSNGNELDLSDGRYVFRNRWLDEDIAVAYFPDRADLIKQSVNNSITDTDEEDTFYLGARVTQAGQDYQSVSSIGKYMPYDGTAGTDNSRTRIKLTECWYKMPMLRRKFNNGEFANVAFDSNKKEHIQALKNGVSLYDKLEMQVRVAIYCEGGLLADAESPYEHKRFPFVPVWCFRRARDHAPYSVIRGLRDPQDDLNKRQSKALWLLSSNRVIADEGAVDDWDELRDEVARPDSLIVKKAGKELRVERDIELAREQLELMDRNVQHIRNVSGVTAENLGRQTNANSGVAITARQEQGGVSTTQIFDNLRYAVQLVGEMELSNIEQFYTEQKMVRITGERGQAKYEEINEPDGNGGFINDITAFEADFVVSEQDYKSSLRQAMFESLFDIVSRLAQMSPQVALNLLDLVIDMADLPNKQQLVDRIRALNGQSDPDAPTTPEEAQAKAAQAQAAQQQQDAQQQLQIQTIESQLNKLKSEADKLDAQALNERITAMYAALQAGQVVATVPKAAAVADEIMSGAGFKPTPQEQSTIAQAAQAAQSQQSPIPTPDATVPQAADAQPADQQQQIQMPRNPEKAAEPLSPDVGVNQGIETMRNDGDRNG